VAGPGHLGFIGTHGLPPQTMAAGWFRVTTDPAMMTASALMVTPGPTKL
jgi:hypothetical protein